MCIRDRLKNIDLEEIVSELSSHEAVDFVDSDTRWLERSNQAISTTRSLSIVSSALAILATVVLALTIALTDLNRHSEHAKVMNQMGASRSILLRPIIFRSLLLAVIAMVGGLLLAWSLLTFVPQIVDMSTYFNLLPTNIPWLKLISLIALAGISATTAAWLFRRKIYFS